MAKEELRGGIYENEEKSVCPSLPSTNMS